MNEEKKVEIESDGDVEEKKLLRKLKKVKPCI